MSKQKRIAPLFQRQAAAPVLRARAAAAREKRQGSSPIYVNTLLTIGQALDLARAAGVDVGHEDSLFLRWMDSVHRPGESLGNSRVWIDGIPTDERLPGVSALRLDYSYGERLRKDKYFGNLHLISGYASLRGEDPGEAIVQDARVVKVLAIYKPR